MDSPSAPSAPDPYATASAQFGANKDAALATAAINRVNQYTPYGSLTWEQNRAPSWNEQYYLQQNPDVLAGIQSGTVNSGAEHFKMYGKAEGRQYQGDPDDVGQWSSKVTLDPRMQQILDSQLQTSQGLQGATQSALGRVNDLYSKAAPTPNMDLRKNVEDALYQRQASRMDPQYRQQEETLRSGLMNRGIVEGSQAWNDQMDNFSRGKNDAYDLARWNAIQGGGQEMGRQYEMEMAGRNAVLNELNALRSGQQVSNPQFGGAGATAGGAQVGAAPIAQAMQNQYQSQMGQYNADVASNNSTMGTIGTLGAAAIAAFF